MPDRPCIYDYPLYYDVLTGWDRDAEASFYDAVLREYGVEPGGRIVEIGCGTGQVGIRLAMLGWQVTGLDLRPPMVEFMAQEAARRGLTIMPAAADMTDFALDEPQDGAVSPIGTFAILQEDEPALRHLDAMARALRPGGVYAMDLALAAPGEGGVSPSEEFDEWQIERDGISIKAEQGRLYVDDAPAGASLELDWGCDLRRYEGGQFVALIERSGAFDALAFYPEAERDEDGVSVFDLTVSSARPTAGRTVVALRRRES